MKKVMMVGCGAYMDSGYGCAGDGPDYVGKPSAREERPPASCKSTRDLYLPMSNSLAHT